MTRQSKCRHCGKWIDQRHDNTEGYLYAKYCMDCETNHTAFMASINNAQEVFFRTYDVYDFEVREVSNKA